MLHNDFLQVFIYTRIIINLCNVDISFTIKITKKNTSLDENKSNVSTKRFKKHT